MQEKKSVIEKIKLDAPTFPGVEVEPIYINFFFGKNGAGKLTIAKVFKSETGITCAAGKNQDDYTILVYNQDFISRNFETYGKFQRVFTLSEVNIVIQKTISKRTEERLQVSADGTTAGDALEKKLAELQPLLNDFQTSCWDITDSIRKSFKATQKNKGRKALVTDELLAGKYKPVDHGVAELQALYDAAFSAESDQQ